MRSNIINSVSIMFVMVLSFVLASDARGQSIKSGSYAEGYGSYRTMG